MLNALIRTRFASLFGSMFRSKKAEGAMSTGKKILFAILWLYVGIVFIGLFGMLFLGLSTMLETEYNWFYFSFAGLASFLFCFIGSVFVAQSQLFEATDNELLLAMPIPPRYILLSRMLFLFFLNYIYEAIIFLPAAVIYFLSGYATVLGTILLILTILFMPLLVLSISCLFGWLLALVSSRMRRKNMLQLVVMVVFLFVYFAFVQNIDQYITDLLENGTAIANAIRSTLPPFYYLGDAIANGNLLSFLYFFLFGLVPMVPIYWLLSKFFIQITTANRGQRKIAYRRQSLQVSSHMWALVRKELGFFTSLPAYMMNGAIGVVFYILIPVFLIIQGEKLTMLISLLGADPSEIICLLITAMLCFGAITNIITSCSISLEGNRLWLIRSLPITSKDILLAKFYMHCLVCIPPGILSALVCCIFLQASWQGYIFAVILPGLVTIFMALFGLIINLHMPKFDWLNETVCVKQSGSTMLAMFGGMALVLVPVVLYIILANRISGYVYLTLLAAILVIACLLMYRYLITKGCILFEKLQS
ncbi:MAG: hypothetical protein IJ315_02810 [Firmicutes bacterium]|nr:hypothetical protein [Bacillota bacterium]